MINLLIKLYASKKSNIQIDLIEMETIPEKKIIEIIEELKTRNLVDPHREIKASKRIPCGFKASVFTSNTISYNPNISGLNDDEIRFCILHEEGHLKRGQYGLPAICLLFSFGLIPLFYCILLKVDLNVMMISIFFMLFIVFSSIRILTEPFKGDEYGSDEFASEILREHYDIKKPSEILKNVLNSIPSSFDRSKILPRLCLAFIEYHPSVEQRVRNIVELIDEKKMPINIRNEE